MNKRSLLAISAMLLVCAVAFSQNLNQTVRGKVTDLDSKQPLIGAYISLADSTLKKGAISDENGNFRIENVPTGRVNIGVTYLGYDNKFIPNVVVNSGKEVTLNIRMQESIASYKTMIVRAYKKNGEPNNDMSLISARSISPDETSRFAGSFNDPSRITANFAGVTATQEGSNDIIIRGNSPKYMQWRLEGIQIGNPNHFGDQSGSGGAGSSLNNNMLTNSDFSTGAFTAEYGDVLSGVYDVQLRTGNNEKFESVFGFGLLGTDFTFEGPFKKGYDGSFIVNYRYSTISIISDLGLVDIGGIPKFQDASFKVVLPTKKVGIFSLFGLGGLSSLVFEDVKPTLWETPGQRSMIGDIKEDFHKNASLANIGLNHSYSLNNHSYFKSSLLFSTDGIDDDVYETKFIRLLDDNGEVLSDSTVDRTKNYTSTIKRNTYRGAFTYNNKISGKHKIQAGTKFALFNSQNKQSIFIDNPSDRTSLTDFDQNIATLRNYISWQHRPTKDLTLVYGLHNMNVLYNQKSTLEPRIAAKYKLNNRSSLNFGYGKHSTMESVHNYFAQVEQNGKLSEPNQDLDLLKAHHLVLGYEYKVTSNITAKLELYYQHLYNLPVENNDTSYYATINEGLEFRFVDLVNEGTGKNYGMELTLERYFNKGYYFLLNTSIYDSKYTSLEGVERNTNYNSNYLFNLLGGKEWDHMGKKKNQTLTLNGKLFFSGGRKIIPLLRDNNGELAVDPASNRYYDYAKAYDEKLDDLYTITLSSSYKWNKPKSTHELMLSVDNMTNNKGRIGEFYDDTEPGNVGYTAQLGIFPNLMYRVYF